MNLDDYSFQIITEQHRQDLYAEAANDRLARLATADHTPLWRRLLNRHTAVSVQPKALLTAHHATH